MTDQTKWGIDMVQQENKAKVHAEQKEMREDVKDFVANCCLLYTSPSPRDGLLSRMPSSA